MLQRMSLRTRFVLFSMACLVPLCIAAVFFLNRGIERNTEQLISNEYTIASLVDRSVMGYFERNIAALDSLAKNPDVASMDPERATPLLGTASTISSEFSRLFLVDNAYRIVGPSDDAPVELVDGLSDQLTQTMEQRQPRISPRITVSEDTVVMVLTMPVITVTETESTDDEPAAGAAPESSDTAVIGTDGTGGETETTPANVVVGAVGVVLPMAQIEDLVLPLARGETEIAVVRPNELFLGTAGIRREEADFLADESEVIELAHSGEIGEFTSTSATGTDIVGVYQPLAVGSGTWATLVTNPAPQSYVESLWVQGLLVLLLAALAILALAVVLGELTARPLRTLAQKAAAMQRGDFSSRIEPVGSGEVRVLSTALAGMTSQLEGQVQGLEDVQHTRENQTRQMRDLLRRTLRLQEDEQRRIASEIHDAVSPLITGALYQARALQMSNGSTPHEESEAALSSVNHLLERATSELHGVIFDLRPPDLDDLGVVAAIQAYATSIQRTSHNVRLELGEEPPQLTSEVRLGMYRIVQEALHNVMRHSGADEALVRLESTENLLRLTIRDNGSGFDPETAIRPTSLGLLSMRERAAAIGASLTIVSRPGGGTAIILERTHTESVMSDDVLADLISVEQTRSNQDGHVQDDGEAGDVSATSGDPSHNGVSAHRSAEGEP
ncbi:MAG: HAMP domain-containing sensor histidine kinase [Chloroflexota bacterium]|nr:HAMP domain-containing sensor histidine kinase [Chloroflexota bacterium]